MILKIHHNIQIARKHRRRRQREMLKKAILKFEQDKFSLYALCGNGETTMETVDRRSGTA